MANVFSEASCSWLSEFDFCATGPALMNRGFGKPLTVPTPDNFLCHRWGQASVLPQECQLLATLRWPCIVGFFPACPVEKKFQGLKQGIPVRCGSAVFCMRCPFVYSLQNLANAGVGWIPQQRDFPEQRSWILEQLLRLGVKGVKTGIDCKFVSTVRTRHDQDQALTARHILSISNKAANL